MLEILQTFDEFGSHVPLPLVQGLAFELLGPSPLAARLVALVPGCAALLCLYPLLRRCVGAVPAALATLFVALNPLHVYYSQLGRSYALAAALGLALVALARRVSAPQAGPVVAWRRDSSRDRSAGSTCRPAASSPRWRSRPSRPRAIGRRGFESWACSRQRRCSPWLCWRPLGRPSRPTSRATPARARRRRWAGST